MNEQTIFAEALERTDPEERAAYLDEACRGDIDLRKRFDRLLAQHEHAGRFLEVPAVAPAPTVDQPITETPQMDIGPYKLLQQIGEGGMGTVWMAQQTEPVRRLVAVKVIKAGMDSRQVIARFEAERQALAIMDHINIARVFDGGTTENGRPYFVMELVRGVPITKYCDDNHLTPLERLELFVPVCQAIQHAHQKGVIHRDIKPSNVMVTLYDGKPVPKVIDFGVAKAIEQTLTERTLFTHYGTMVGTLEYMSPEQAEMSALGVDTRSDIFSLGVLLYELLTGSTPLSRNRVKEAALAEVIRLIKEEEPPKPSTRLSDSGESLASISALRHTDPVKLTRLLRGELDWIVMKCLEKDRNRRYETANNFAADIQRYLNDETVQACPPSTGYRIKKFTRKYRKLLVTTGIIAMLLVSATVISTWQWREASVHRNRAEAKTAEAAKNLREARKSVDEWFTTISQTTLLDAPGLQPLRKQLLESALAYYQGLRKQAADDPELRADLAATHMRMSLILISLDRNDDATAAFLEGLEKVEQLLKDRPEDKEFPKRLAGFFRTPRNLYQQTRPPADAVKATKTLERSVEIWEQFVQAFPETREFRGDLAGMHMLLGALTQSPDPKRSLGHSRRSRELLEELVRSKPSDATYNELLVGAYSEMAYLLERAGSPQECQQISTESIRFFEELSQQFPTERGLRHRLATVQSQFAGRICAARPDEAEAIYRKSIAILENLTAESPTDSQFRRELYTTYHALAGALRQRNREVEADELAAKALALNEKLVLEFPDMPEFRQVLASRYSTKAILLTQAQPFEAVLACRQALDIHEKLVADFPTDGRHFEELQKVQTQLVGLLHATGQHQKLEQVWRRAILWHEKMATADPLTRERKMDLARCHNRLGLLLRGRGKLPEAEIELRQAQRLWAEVGEPELKRLRSVAEAEPNNGMHWGNLAIAHYKFGQWDEAISIYRDKEHFGHGLAGSAWQWLNIALAHWQLDHKEEAFAYFYKSMDWVENNMEKRLLDRQSEAAISMQLPDIGNRPEEAWNHLRVAKALENKGEHDRAVDAYGKAAESYEFLYLQYPAVPVYRNKLVDVLKAIGKSSEIGRIDQEAVARMERVVASDPTIPVNRVGLGKLYQSLGKREQAEAEFSAAIQQVPKSSVVWDGRAFFRFQSHQWEGAIADYTEAIKLAPRVHSSWWHRGHAYLNTLQWENAAADFTTVVKGWPNEYAGWFYRGIAFAQLNQPEKAVADLQEAIATGLKDAEWLKNDARLAPLRDREDFGKLIQDLEQK